MIEFCTKKRMALAVVMLIGASVVALMAESYVSNSSHSFASSKSAGLENTTDNTTAPCPDGKVAKVVKPCAVCSNFDKKVHPYECGKTGYAEIVHCKSKADTFRSCPKLGPIEEKKFFMFEGLTFAFGIASYGLVFIRRKRLDRMLMEKVHKQIGAGV